MKKSVYLKCRDGEYRVYGGFDDISVNNPLESRTITIICDGGARTIFVDKDQMVYIDIGDEIVA